MASEDEGPFKILREWLVAGKITAAEAKEMRKAIVDWGMLMLNCPRE